MEAVEADRKGKRANVDQYNKKIANSRICQGIDPDIPKERGYEVAYNETIKGSIEEELADAVIRLLELAGYRGISLELANGDIDDCVEDMAEACKDETFTESIYSISTLPVRYDGIFDFSDIDFSRFTFSTDTDPSVLVANRQQRKFNSILFKVESRDSNPFSLLEIVGEFIFNGKFKG